MNSWVYEYLIGIGYKEEEINYSRLEKDGYIISFKIHQIIKPSPRSYVVFFDNNGSVISLKKPRIEKNEKSFKSKSREIGTVR